MVLACIFQRRGKPPRARWSHEYASNTHESWCYRCECIAPRCNNTAAYNAGLLYQHKSPTRVEKVRPGLFRAAGSDRMSGECLSIYGFPDNLPWSLARACHFCATPRTARSRDGWETCLVGGEVAGDPIFFEKKITRESRIYRVVVYVTRMGNVMRAYCFMRKRSRGELGVRLWKVTWSNSAARGKTRKMSQIDQTIWFELIRFLKN